MQTCRIWTCAEGQMVPRAGFEVERKLLNWQACGLAKQPIPPTIPHSNRLEFLSVTRSRVCGWTMAACGSRPVSLGRTCLLSRIG